MDRPKNSNSKVPENLEPCFSVARASVSAAMAFTGQQINPERNAVEIYKYIILTLITSPVKLTQKQKLQKWKTDERNSVVFFFVFFFFFKSCIPVERMKTN